MKGSKSSKGDHEEAVARQLGRPIRAQPKVKCPEGLRYIWDWFLELTGRRTAGATAWNPLSYLEVEAWARLMDRRLTPWEVGLLMQLDDTFLTTRGGQS